MKVYLDTTIVVTRVQEFQVELLFKYSLLIDFTLAPFRRSKLQSLVFLNSGLNIIALCCNRYFPATAATILIRNTYYLFAAPINFLQQLSFFAPSIIFSATSICSQQPLFVRS